MVSSRGLGNRDLTLNCQPKSLANIDKEKINVCNGLEEERGGEIK